MAFDVLEPEAAAVGYDVLQPEAAAPEPSAAPTPKASGYDILEREQFTGTPEMATTTPPRSSEELGAMNAAGERSFARANAPTAPDGPQLLQGPTGFDRILGDIGRSAPVRGVKAALSLPARITGWAGKAAQAGLGDLAANASDNPDAGGNLAELARGNGQSSLPIERAVKLSADADRQAGTFPVASIVAQTSLGVADLLPKILALEVAPGSSAAGGTAAQYLARSGSAADLFGFDDKGNFQAKDAVVGGLFPYVMRAAAASANVALETAVKNGVAQAGSPLVQKAVHVAATQAAMNGLVASANAPDLLQLAQTDPNKFRERLAAMVGQNLAFSLPDLLQKYSPLSFVPGDQTPAPIDVESEVTPSDSSTAPIEPQRQIQGPAAAESGQPAGEPETPPGGTPPETAPSSPPVSASFPGRRLLDDARAAAADPEARKGNLATNLAAVESALAARVEPEAVPQSGTAPTEAPAASPQNAPEPEAAAGETIPPSDRLDDLATNLAALESQLSARVETPPSEPQPAPVQIQTTAAPSTPAVTAAAPTSAGASLPQLTPPAVGAIVDPVAAAETGTGQNGGTAPDAALAGQPAREQMPAEPETRPNAATGPLPRPHGKPSFYIRPRSDGVPDILDAIQELGGIRAPGKRAGGEYDGYREAMQGMARMLVTRKSTASSIDQIIPQLQDMGFPRMETPDHVWDAITAAVKSREKLKQSELSTVMQSKQTAQFQAKAIQNDRPKKEAANVEKIQVNDLLPGDTFKVQNHHFTVEQLHFDDQGNLAQVEVQDGPKFGVQRVDADEWIHMDKGTFKPGPDHGQGFPIPEQLKEGGDLFGAPESVEEQKARLAKEAKINQAAEAKKQVAQRAGQRLVGGDIDTTGDLLTGDHSSRVDKSGQGSLFERQRDAIGSHPVDKPALAGLGSLYGIDPNDLQAVLRDHRAYQQSFDFKAPAKGSKPVPAVPQKATAAAAGPGLVTAPQAGQSPALSCSAEATREALKTLNPLALSRAFGHNTLVSSIDPTSAPHEVPQYRVNGTVIQSPADFAKTLIALRSPYSESLKVVILNKKGVVIHSQVLYGGTLDTLSVDARDFVRLANRFKDQGVDMMISHNHPSGDPTPSAGDIAFTHRLNRFAKMAGFNVVDHVITNGRRFYSFRHQSMCDIDSPALAPWEKVAREDLPRAHNPFVFNDLVTSLRQSNPDVSHIIYLNTQRQVSAIERAEPNADAIGKQMLVGIGREGARSVAIDYGPKVNTANASQWTELLKRSLVGTDSQIIDFASAGTMSARLAGLLKEEPKAPQAPTDTLKEEPENPAPEEPEEETPEPRDYPALIARQQEITKRLAELPSRGGTPDDRSERFALSRESMRLQRLLSKNEDYVSQLLIRADQAGNDLQIAKKAGNNLHAKELSDAMDSLMADIAQVPPDLFKRVYNDLVARKLIMASQTGPLNAPGRTLGELTSWLEAQTKDSPNLSLLQRLNLWKKLTDQLNAGKDAATRGMNGLAATWQMLKQSYLQGAPLDTPFRALMKNWFAEKEFTGLEVDRFLRSTKVQVPNPLRRQAMAVWLDAGGDMNLLLAQSQEMKPRWRAVWEAALKLTPGEIAICRRLQTEFAQKLEDAQKLGLVEKGREDYGVPQIWKEPPRIEGEYDPTVGKVNAQKSRSPLGKLDPRNPFFSLERRVPSYFDGIMGGGVPMGLDVADLVAFYNQQFQDALSDRGVIKDLKDAKAPDGLPAVMIGGAAQIAPLPDGARTYFVDSNWRPKDAVTADGRLYRSVDHWALKDWQFASKDANGNKILVRGDFLVHPDHYAFLKNELSKSALRDPDGPLGQFAKATNLALTVPLRVPVLGPTFTLIQRSGSLMATMALATMLLLVAAMLVRPAATRSMPSVLLSGASSLLPQTFTVASAPLLRTIWTEILSIPITFIQVPLSTPVLSSSRLPSYPVFFSVNCCRPMAIFLSSVS